MPTDVPLRSAAEIESVLRNAVAKQPVTDIHTHLYPASFGTTLAGAGKRAADESGLLLWGIDELLNYHYLVAETFRVVPATTLPYETFWKMDRTERADLIYKTLFVDRSPVSEACRGVLTTLQKLGLDPADRDLNRWRKWFGQQDPDQYISKVMELSNVSSITMTNAVFDDNERNRWLADPNVGKDPRFTAVLRIDPLLRDWPTAAKKLSEWGYRTSLEITDSVVAEVKRFLTDWIGRMNPIYLALSLPPEFRYPANLSDAVAKAGQTILERAILPVCAERKLPWAMMIGSRLRVNPALRDAGDMVGYSDVLSVVNLCARFPENKFLVTMLARENQHELCVAARKFGNLMIFGCWWFLNNPSLIEEITSMRMELLGTSMIPQHSDARVLEQMLYKWEHSRKIIADVLVEQYTRMAAAGWAPTKTELERDVRLLLADNFAEFIKR